MSRPPWLDIADGEMGVEETPGAGSTARIMEYFRATGGDWVKGDDTPWCGAFVGYVIKKAGFALPKEPLRARGWSRWGTASDLVPGAIVVISRGKDPKLGHVGILIKVVNGKVYLQGGNQNDRVSIEAFPASRVVAVRWPPEPAATAPVPVPVVDSAPAAPATPAAPGERVKEAAKSSRTILGALLGLFGTLLQYFEGVVGGLIEAAGEVAKIETATPILAMLGANTKSIGFGLAVFGIIVVITRRLDAAAKGKIG